MFIPVRLVVILTLTIIGGSLLWGMPGRAASQGKQEIERSRTLDSGTYDPGDVGNPDDSQGAGSRFVPRSNSSSDN